MLAVAKIRLILYSILGLIIIFLIYQAVVPLGQITYSITPCDNSFFIQKLQPKERVSEVDKTGCTQKIIGEPVYFNLNTQRTFNQAAVTVTYQDSGQNNIIELGPQADEWKNYILRPLENKIIDRLNWNKISGNGAVLYQREKKFKTIEEFLNNLPPREEILAYKYDLPQLKYIEGYQNTTGLPACQSYVLCIAGRLRRPEELGAPRNDILPLRGAYQFYTYLKNEPLDFNFSFSDLNLNKDADNIKVAIYYKDEQIAEKNLADERGGEEERQRADAGNIKLNMANLPEGFYKISVIANDDIITDKIISSQNIVSFINRIWLAENENKPIALYSDVPEATISTLNAASLQKINVNGDSLELAETYRQFSLPTRQSQSTLKLKTGDVILSGAGVFSFSEDAFYDPDYKKMVKTTDVDEEKINYIITSYSSQNEGEVSSPRPLDSWKTKTVSFDLTKAFRYKNNYNFIISVPGLIAEDGVDDWVEIKNIKVELKGSTIFDKFQNFQF